MSGLPEHASIIPTMRYKDARTAIDWLCDAFGFSRKLIVDGADDSIAHAQLTYRNGMIMLASSGTGQFDALQKTPDGVGGVGTQSPYIVVADADAHYAAAVRAGARIVVDIKDEDYGGRVYSCLDPEGHLWNFGTYDPWSD